MLMSRLRFLIIMALLAAALHTGGLAAAASTSQSLTFLIISDLHYDWPEPGNYTLQRAAIKAMNEIPGTAYPKALGGTVAAPRGVLALGDLVESNKTAAFAAWEGDYGLKGEKLLKYPVYELLGNHDNGGTPGWEGIKRRNPLRADVENISPNGYHYSWNWSGVHFVALNICAANEADPSLERKTNPRGALDFLADDLKRAVGESGRPVIVLQHFPLTQRAWISQAQVDALEAALKPYNIILMAHGHTHTSKVYAQGKIDVLDDGSVKNGAKMPEGNSSFYIARIEGNRLTVQQRHVDGQWGEISLEKRFAWSKDEQVAPERKVIQPERAATPVKKKAPKKKGGKKKVKAAGVNAAAAGAAQ